MIKFTTEQINAVFATEDPMRFRVVRPDGTVLEEWMAGPQGPLGITLLREAGGGYAIGEYEYQQWLDEEWVPLTRFNVKPPEPAS